MLNIDAIQFNEPTSGTKIYAAASNMKLEERLWFGLAW